MLGGRSTRGNWHEEVTKPATTELDLAASRVHRSAEDIAANNPPSLSNGVGAMFNEPVVPVDTGQGVLLSALVFFQLFTTLAMKRLVGYGNSYDPLKAQKDTSLQDHPDSLYPCDSSVFSAATVDFGGPPCCIFAPGVPDRQQVRQWSILTALGNYKPRHGGHVIFWDLGLVVCFPPGSSILIPTGLIRYSFVRVRPGERRYSLLQWAGAGIARWFLNNGHSDMQFAKHATPADHAAREERCAQAQAPLLGNFPVEGDIRGAAADFPFTGTWPHGT
ncbi:hypothetical protein B0H16DRAFT_1484810 [Mycena metata]|uniref:Uncharacterized protein n=1 Tax=Mycena metata TaxID=1033252 RepID=A0AAD7GNG1_9AGAR|nr:hypothetical protein B0H16DRAFT_1484810 [Mycena metata]